MAPMFLPDTVAVIDLARLLEQDIAETTKLIHALENPGYSYLDFRNAPTTEAVANEARAMYALADEYFQKPEQAKARDHREGQPSWSDRGYKSCETNESFEMSTDEMRSNVLRLPERLAKEAPLVASFHGHCAEAARILLAQLAAALDLPILESVHDESEPSETGLKLISEPSVPFAADVVENKHRDSSTLTLLFYDSWSIHVTQPVDGAGKRYYLSYFLRPDHRLREEWEAADDSTVDRRAVDHVLGGALALIHAESRTHAALYRDDFPGHGETALAQHRTEPSGPSLAHQPLRIFSMAADEFRDSESQESAYSDLQVAAWLERISLPAPYKQYWSSPSTIPKTEDSLRTLFRCQITTFPYENLSVHYSPTHKVDINPASLYAKMMEAPHNGRGGYCMELSIFFHHMLRGLGFPVYMTGVRNRTRTDGVPRGEYQGWTHINNIIHLPCGAKFSADVAFGGDGPTSPLPMDGLGAAVQNLGPQEVRLVHDTIPKQRLHGPKLWIYQYRNGADREWNPFYSFAELEFFQEDFEVQNWWTSVKTLHRWTVLVVRFLRRGEPVDFAEAEAWRRGGDDQRGDDDDGAVQIVGKVMLVNDAVKVNMGAKTQVVHRVDSEEGRRKALRDYFGIRLTDDEAKCIEGWDMALPASS
ncbi:N-hydroxyarylamine O-acetyltransferase [Purpureocillium lavendulum]|uniref:N-hydroxyarylamine O-acetyltransferase n=1 Tax=Purpureocillium lavendulum TaxID=1247861 RepID=A0AB34FP91_9HYPO|nr:N-hydroxyarylamine O-acetyltransferase [Purpureocillium lavendulum]